MTVLTWIGLIVGGIILTVGLLGLIRPILRMLRLMPSTKAAPPTGVSGVLGLLILLILVFLARAFGIGPVLLWVWVAVGAFLLVVVIMGLFNRAVQARKAG